MPASSCTLPRQMFPPPTTIAMETPARLTSAISSAIARVVFTSTPVVSPANASPDIFKRTREKRGPGNSLTKGVSGEAPYANAFAERADRTMHEVAHAHRIVLDERLIEQAVLLEPLVKFSGNDLLCYFGRLARRHCILKLGAQPFDYVSRHALAIEIKWGHRGDVHRDIARKFAEPRVARNEVRFTVDLKQHTDLAAGMNVACHQPLIRRTLGLLCRLCCAALEQQRLRALHVTRSIQQRLAAIQHRRASLFAQRLNLFGPRLIRDHSPASAIVVGA